MPEPLDPAKASDLQLNKLKEGYAADMGTIVAKLCETSERADADAIINRIGDDMEQLFLIAEEIGRREGLKEKQ